MWSPICDSIDLYTHYELKITIYYFDSGEWKTLEEIRKKLDRLGFNEITKFEMLKQIVETSRMRYVIENTTPKTKRLFKRLFRKLRKSK